MDCVKTTELVTVTLRINVRYASNTYITERVLGKTASSTGGPENAARSVARKVFGTDATFKVTPVVHCACNAPGTYEVQATYPREARQ